METLRRRHRPGPWAPVMPVEVGPFLFGGDTRARG